MTRTIFAAGACALALTTAAQAQSLPDTGGVTVLDTITVTTPLRRTSSLERTTSSVTVIEREEIRQSASVDLASLLKTHAGVSVALNGGIGAAGGLGIRGTKASQTLVLVNGVRIGSAVNGSVALFNIPLDSIERIEIARGTHSAQYGADAIGGIVNIITGSGGVCPDGAASCTRVSAGVMHPWGGSLSLDTAGHAGGWDYSFGGSFLGTRGYEFTSPPLRTHEADDDGFRRGSFHYSLSKDFGWGLLYSSGLVARARTEYDHNSLAQPNETERDTLTGRLGVRLDHSQSWKTTLELNLGVDNKTDFRRGTDVEAVFDSARYGMLALTEKSFATGPVDHIVSAGVEAYREQIGTTGAYAVKRRDIAAAFGQYSLEYAGLIVDTGLRFDYNEQFGDATTYNVGASYAILPELTVRGSHATGFRSPSFNELYYSTPGIGDGNPDLRPERSNSVEVGLNWQPSAQTSLDVSVYRNRIRDQINWNRENYPALPMFPDNLERVTITGIEAVLDHRFDDRWGVRASLDVRRPINKVTGKYVSLEDRFRASVEVDYQATEKLWLKAGVFHVGTRFANDANTEKMPAYTTLDVAGIYRLDDRSELKLSIENLFDKRYQRIKNYNAMGRTINLSFSRTF